MAYVATWTNKRQQADGAEATLVLRDDTGTYPDHTCNKYFRGKTVAQLTNAFLLPFAKVDGAMLIEQSVLAQANAILDANVAAAWAQTMTAAFANFRTVVQNGLAGSNIDAASIQTRILNQWSAYNVDGVLNNPVVTISVTMPDAPHVNTGGVVDVKVSN